MHRCLRNGKGSTISLPGGSGSVELELRCRPREIPRDWDRRVFGTMMREKLTAALKEQRGEVFIHVSPSSYFIFQVLYGIEGGDPQKVVWQKLLEFVRKHSLVVTNWPLGVSPPGPGFNFKKLKASTLHKLVVPYLHRKLGHMYDGQTDDEEAKDSGLDIPEIEIKLWHEGMIRCNLSCTAHSHTLDIIRIPDTNPIKGDMALIKASDGTVLRKIMLRPVLLAGRDGEQRVFGGRRDLDCSTPRVRWLRTPLHGKAEAQGSRPSKPEKKGTCPIGNSRGIAVRVGRLLSGSGKVLDTFLCPLHESGLVEGGRM